MSSSMRVCALVLLASACAAFVTRSSPPSLHTFERTRITLLKSSPNSGLLPKEQETAISKLNGVVVGAVKDMLGLVYEGRPFARFYALETIARVPYFSYVSVLHLYETLGQWRKADLLKLHFAESWNELHHLRIMEELGGNSKFTDRWVAQHVAFFYYWIVVGLYILSPKLAYNLNEQVERHAFETYDKFLESDGEELKKLPAPQSAKEYYQTGDLYMFDAFQTEEKDVVRRPVMNTLYDAFVAIRDDEGEHVKTMFSMQDDGALDSGVVAPPVQGNPQNVTRVVLEYE